MVKEIRARLRLSEETETAIKQIAERHHRDVNDEMVVAVEEYIEKEKAVSPQHRPCIIKVGLDPDSQEGVKSGLEHLHTLFNYVDGKNEAEGFNVLCAGPKDGLSYGEAFIICQQRYFEVGWVYADAVFPG